MSKQQQEQGKKIVTSTQGVRESIGFNAHTHTTEFPLFCEKECATHKDDMKETHENTIKPDDFFWVFFFLSFGLFVSFKGKVVRYSTRDIEILLFAGGRAPNACDKARTAKKKKNNKHNTQREKTQKFELRRSSFLK